MATVPPSVSPSPTTCSSLLHELQIICEEIGESDGERDKMLLQLEQECLDIYRRKVEKTRKHRADLYQSLAESEAEIANLVSALGERTSFSRLIRLQRVNRYIHTIHQLSVVMSFDFFETVSEIHPSLTGQMPDQSKSISNDTVASLTSMIHSLKQEKEQRLRKLQKLGRKLVELSNLMDTPAEEQKRFDHITILMSSSIDELSRPGSLALEAIEQVEVEVERLNVLKASKMKELVMKRQIELEEIYRGVHMDVDSDSARKILMNLIDSGTVDLSDLLANMDDQIAKAKEQASSRRDILDRVEKWQHAAEEERWLDDYEKDENRYSAGRGAHKNLKRAEKARILVSKLPSMVESLKSKMKTWESEKGIPFSYNKVPLLHILEEYNIQRQEREEEKRRSREQKRLQEQLATEQEAVYGSRPSTKKSLGLSMNTNNLPGTPVSRRGAAPGHYGLSGGKDRRETGRANTVIPVNYVALPKDGPNTRGN